MKLKGKSNNAGFSLSLTGIFLALAGLSAHAGTMGPVAAAPGNIYAGVFGGGGASTKTDLSQYGTAFFPEAAGGPLAVDAFGRTNSRSMGMVGGQIGYQWTDIVTAFTSWTLTPAFEAEGYYLGKSNFTGHEVNNNTTRLPEHDFAVTYPTSAGVFLINAVLNFNSDSWLRPYIGAGIGGAVFSINNANALQVSPLEVGVNHYNSNTSSKDSAFAGQIKVGSNFAVNPHVSIFAEYRWLYAAPTSYTFGSTSYPTHAATSAWRVDFGAQKYNMGSAGIRYTF
ncbi:outer membrane protein [Legionella dresdenensis]|uniref:Outer membrane protein n=1 Tax=Legionella dresdenensis TaxID=450200 RepID=A0ABV8CFP6_9GAMM